MASDVATMQPDHDLEPERPRFRRGGERLGEAAGLVELDVHRVVARGQVAERGAVMHRLVGADRDDAGDVLQELRRRRRAAAAR